MTGTNNKLGNFKHKTTCRICGSRDLEKFLSLGPTPLANNFLKEEQLGQEQYYPLDVYFCNNCYLIQLLDIVPPEVMFRDYAYMTSASNPMKTHFLGLAEEVNKNFKFNKNGMVIDIGSNDGTLLQCFSNYGFNTVGVEPASNIAKLAEEKGIRTVNDFFDVKTAVKIREEFGDAHIITGTNVFAHIDDLESILHGVNHLLSDEGVFIIEAPYLLNLLNNIEFDTIYHEHLSYFSLHPLVYLFKKFDLTVVDVRQIPVHGGSIRVFAQKAHKPQSQNVKDLLLKEQNAEVYSFDTYLRFAQNVASVKEKLTVLLKKLKEKGSRITGYGATAKGNTLLNYCRIGTDLLDYISDTTFLKQGTYSPGMHIPIVSEKKFHEVPPDYALLLAWNYADEILKKESEYRKKGGKFILPIPEPKVI